MYSTVQNHLMYFSSLYSALSDISGKANRLKGAAMNIHRDLGVTPTLSCNGNDTVSDLLCFFHIGFYQSAMALDR